MEAARASSTAVGPVRELFEQHARDVLEFAPLARRQMVGVGLDRRTWLGGRGTKDEKKLLAAAGSGSADRIDGRASARPLVMPGDQSLRAPLACEAWPPDRGGRLVSGLDESMLADLASPGQFRPQKVHWERSGFPGVGKDGKSAMALLRRSGEIG